MRLVPPLSTGNASKHLSYPSICPPVCVSITVYTCTIVIKLITCNSIQVSQCHLLIKKKKKKVVKNILKMKKFIRSAQLVELPFHSSMVSGFTLSLSDCGESCIFYSGVLSALSRFHPFPKTVRTDYAKLPLSVSVCMMLCDGLVSHLR